MRGACNNPSRRRHRHTLHREVHEQLLDKETGQLNRVAWTNNGRILSVSTLGGCFMAYRVLAGGSKASGGGG